VGDQFVTQRIDGSAEKPRPSTLVAKRHDPDGMWRKTTIGQYIAAARESHAEDARPIASP
jgi:hypothetical protein